MRKGDVIISRLRPYLRQVAYVDEDRKEILGASTEFFVIRARNNESIAYLVPFCFLNQHSWYLKIQLKEVSILDLKKKMFSI